MDVQAYLRHFIGLLHRQYEQALADLTEEQCYFRPSATTNHIAFTAWHWVRTEDNVINFALQRRPTVWLERGLDTAWGLPKAAQGTGMPREEAQALRLPSIAVFLDYARAVWAATDRYLDTVTPEELSRIDPDPAHRDAAVTPPDRTDHATRNSTRRNWPSAHRTESSPKPGVSLGSTLKRITASPEGAAATATGMNRNVPPLGTLTPPAHT